MSLRRISILILAAFLCSSCVASHNANTLLYSPQEELRLCRMAVMPFVNETDEVHGAELISRIFHNALIEKSTFEIAPEGSVKQFLLRNRLLAEDFFDAKTAVYANLGNELHVDAFLRGKILDFGEEEGGEEGLIPFLHLQIEMIEAKNGKLITSSFHRRRGSDYRKMMHFGIIRTKTRLMAQAVDEIIAKWKEEGIIGCR